ncbi:hypothetical protein [Streptomyces carpinensis]|uniref:Uncharacterized protein n=1 Tax=Streptomyces carpinensis TaxID=66369 RepID=A0ABV1VZZ6_9ACTN|nr:hypothetical protein [Streptomyces carpinensis]
MATSAKQQIDEAVRKHRDMSGAKGAAAHPASRAEADRSVALALAQSNMELAAALQGLTEALGRNQGEFKKTIASLAAKLTELANR